MENKEQMAQRNHASDEYMNQLEYNNQLFLVRLEEALDTENRMQKEIDQMKQKQQELRDLIAIQSDKVESLTEDRDYYSEENEHMVEELEIKNREIEELEDINKDQICQWEKEAKVYEEKIKKLDEALKAKNKQLIDHINRDRGEMTNE